MNPEIWSKPYNYAFENEELRATLIKFFEALAQAKRIQIDPFENKIKIRCTVSGCKERYAGNLEGFQSLGRPGYESLEALEIGHAHFYNEIGFGRSLGSFYSKYHRNSSTRATHLCALCLHLAPFPWHAWDSHNCNNNDWGLSLNKPNTLSWRGSAWVLYIDYSHNLWQKLLKHPQRVQYDEKSVGFVVDDFIASAIVTICKIHIPSFRHVPKPKVFAGAAGPRGLVNSSRALAANEILNCIPENLLPRVKRAIQQVLHPDRDPSNKDALTKAFQNFEESWRKWEGRK